MRTLPSLNALRVFETAGKCCSFTVAAKQLCVTQSAVSRQVKQLEDYLGVPLFIREPHKLELTEAGANLISELDKAFNLIEEGVKELRTPNQRLTLTVLACPTYATRWLAPRLADFTHLYPDLNLSIHNQQADHTLFDCEIRFDKSAKSADSEQDKLLMLEHLLPVCSPSLLKKAQQLEDWNHCLIHILHEGRQRLPSWKDWLNAAGLNGRIDDQLGLEFSTMDQVINAVCAGTGFAIIDKHMIARELSSGELVQFHDAEVIGPYGYWFNIKNDHMGLSKVNLFSDWLVAQNESTNRPN